jgi:hypothetical protein
MEWGWMVKIFSIIFLVFALLALETTDANENSLHPTLAG